jgi:RNA polymerase sigma-70 factor (ECF subfamily)
VDNLSDRLLLRQYLQGDRGAFDALYRRYAARIHATAYRLTGSWEDAEDVLQDVFITLANKAATVRQGRALQGWLYRTAFNCAIDRLRQRRPTVSLDEPTPQAARVIAVEGARREAERHESARRDSLLREVEALMPNLPRNQAAVFVLRGFQGLAHREIASIVGCSEASSKSHYSLACKKLRKWITEARESCAPGALREEADR